MLHLKLSVIIPAYNEIDTIQEAILRVSQLEIDKEIIVVDDCSTDGTRDVLRKTRDIKLLLHDCNMGKGMAIRTALAEVTGDIVIIQDADLEYDPQDFREIVRTIESGRADVVYGSRFLNGRPPMKLANYVANRILALAASILYGVKVTDEATCYKAIRTALIQGMSLTCRRFEFCPEVTAKLLRKRARFIEIPIHYTPRTVAQGKKINWWDGVVALWTLIRYRFVK